MTNTTGQHLMHQPLDAAKCNQRKMQSCAVCGVPLLDSVVADTQTHCCVPYLKQPGMQQLRTAWGSHPGVQRCRAIQLVKSTCTGTLMLPCCDREPLKGPFILAPPTPGGLQAVSRPTSTNHPSLATTPCRVLLGSLDGSCQTAAAPHAALEPAAYDTHKAAPCQS